MRPAGAVAEGGDIPLVVVDVRAASVTFWAVRMDARGRVLTSVCRQQRWTGVRRENAAESFCTHTESRAYRPES